MGTKITINTVIECKDQESAKRVLLEAMNHRLCSYFKPMPSELEGSKEIENWRWENWGNLIEIEFDSGWIQNKSVFLKFFWGSPKKFCQWLESHDQITTYTLNYMGHDDWSAPDYSGVVIDGIHTAGDS
jgi:hypothetical protein